MLYRQGFLEKKNGGYCMRKNYQKKSDRPDNSSRKFESNQGKQQLVTLFQP
jgi:hypothetical protein